MTPKLLQKKSNRFLQLALPENLIANKRIGKRKKYNHFPRAAAKNLGAMEKRILGQWAFSWNMYKKTMKKQQGEISFPPRITQVHRPESMKTQVHDVTQDKGFALPRARFTTLPPSAGTDFLSGPGSAFSCFLVSPSLYILQDRISRALGGNLIQYLKQSNTVIPGGKGMPLSAPLAPLGKLPFHAKGRARKTGRAQVQVSDLLHPPALWREDDRGCFSGKKGGVFLETLCPPLISDAPVDFGHKRGELLISQCRDNFFNKIYSLLAAQILRNKARGDRRDRIADHYRNQLSEWRKISFLYGGLGLKAARRLHGRARLLGGDVDSNFLSLLESRLDVTLKRAFFFSTLKAARQWIQRGKINVNNQRCTVASAVLQPADLITISPSATGEWRKSRLKTFSLIREKGMPLRRPGPPLNWNRNRIFQTAFVPAGAPEMKRPQVMSNTAQHRGVLWPKGQYRKGNPAQRYFASVFHGSNSQAGGLHGSHRGARQMKTAQLDRRFPFSPALMRKLKEWSQVWGNCRYSFSEKHQGRAIGILSTSQPLYSTSCLAHYLAATKFKSKNSQSLAISDPEINVKKNLAPGVALDFSLLQRGQTSITSFICGLPLETPGPRNFFQPQGNAHHQVGAGKRNKWQHGTTRAQHVPTGPVRIRLGQCLGRERQKRLQWLHRVKSNVLDGLYALRWNRGFARKKSQREKKNQWRWSCIKPLHLECCYKLGTVIFLFSPQKLAWPASINVSLIREKLGG